MHGIGSTVRLLLLAAAASAGCAPKVGQVQIVEYQPSAVKLPEDVRRLAIGAVKGQTAEDADWARMTGDLLEGRLTERAGSGGRYEIVRPRRTGRPDQPTEEIDGIVTAEVHVTRQRSSILDPARGETETAPARTREVWTAAIRFGVSRPGGQTLLVRRLTDRCEFAGHPRDTDEALGKPGPPVLGMLDRCVKQFVSQLLPAETVHCETLRQGASADTIEANRLAGAGRYAQALARYERALAKRPDDEAALFNAGLMCELLGKFAAAEGYYLRAYQQTGGAWCQSALSRVRRGRTRQGDGR